LRGRLKGIVRRARGQSRSRYRLVVVRGERSGRGNDNREMADDLCGGRGEWPHALRLEAAVKRFFSILFAVFPLPFLSLPPSLILFCTFIFFFLSPLSDRVISH
jgi:hypothetical protein